MDIRLICMDLDGTTLQSDRESFSPRLHAALEEAHRRGIAIAPVTGRQYGLLPRVLKENPVWQRYAVVCNGAQIRKLGSGEVLYSLDIAPEALEMLLDLAEKWDLPIEFSLNSILYLTAHAYEQQLPYPNLAFHRDVILAHNGAIVDSLRPLCAEGVEKVNLLCIGPEIREQVEAGLKQIPVSAVWASSSSMEITHPLGTKAEGIKRLCRMLDIPPEQTMALGDSGNDESMLQTAGLSVAMGNAPENIRALADVVTETNENDGAAIAIERYALKNKQGCKAARNTNERRK